MSNGLARIANLIRQNNDDAKQWKNKRTVRLGDGSDAGNVVVLPADKKYAGFPLFYAHEANEAGEIIWQDQVVPWFPGLTWDNSQRHMKVYIHQIPDFDPKLWFITGFTEDSLMQWGGATPAQVGIQQAAAVTPDKWQPNKIYFSSGVTLGYSGYGFRYGDEFYPLNPNVSFVDLTSYIPAVASTERWVNVSINTAGAVGIIAGDTFADSETDKKNYMPKTIPSGGYLHLGSVLLANGLVAGTNDLIDQYKDLQTVPSVASSTTAIELANLEDVTSATQTANFVLAAGDGATGGEYRGRLLVDADIPGTLTITGGAISGASVTVTDANLTIQDDAAPTKQFKFQASGITAGQTRVLTVPNFDGTIATLAGTETFTNKTLGNTTTVSTGASQAIFGLVTNAGVARSFIFYTGSTSTPRWELRTNATAESGSDVGSDFLLVRYSDAGVGATVMSIVRSTGTVTFNSSIISNVDTALTNTTTDAILLRHNTSGSPVVAGFGIRQLWQMESSTTSNRNAFSIAATWADPTDASRTATVAFNVFDTVGRTAITIAATGTVATVTLAATTINPNLTVTQPTLGSEVMRLQSTATNDDPVEIVYQNRVATTDATVTTLHTFTVPASTTYRVEANVTARRTGGSAGTAEDGAGYVIRGTYKNVAGTATLIGAVSAAYTAEDQAAWDATLDVTGATVRVRVTGAVNNNVTWHVSARVYQVST